MHSHSPDIGSTVGPWLILQFVDSGSFGIVYQARRAELPSSPPVAVKMARNPYDARFHREAQLLQRLSHPSIPRFEGLGVWMGLEDTRYPYVAMEWVEGLTLYRWCEAQPRTSREVLRVLAQLAEALATAHAQGTFHRDVKGNNIRVRSDGHAVLLDWGSGWFADAEPLTDTSAPPSTSAYRPPEQRAFQWQFRKDMEAHWNSTATDDLYALGVTLYRLVTGKYLPPCTDGGEPVPRQVPPPSDIATVAPELEALILRLISDERMARGSAARLAQECAALVETGGLGLDTPIRPTPSAAKTEEGGCPSGVRSDEGAESPKARVAVPPPAPSALQERAAPAWLTWVGASAIGGLMGALVVLLSRPAAPEPEPNPDPWLATQEEVTRFAPDAGVAEEALASVENARPQTGPIIASFSRSMPSQPFPTQRRPPCERGERAINGGCWIGPIEAEKPPCGDKMFDYEGRCYFISYGGTRQPTSGEP